MTRKALSGVMLTLLFTSMLILFLDVQLVEASETIYIRADGSVDPTTAPISSIDNVTYTFTDNIYDQIRVERSNIIILGPPFSLTIKPIHKFFRACSKNLISGARDK